VFSRERRFGFACALAYGSEVIAFGDDFIPGTEVPGFYLEALCTSFGFGFFVWSVHAVWCDSISLRDGPPALE
jgi:hypothetical protein